MSETRNDLDARRRRTLYRAVHRGTKEMDWLLGRYAEAEVSGMNLSDLEGFEEFLALPDSDIHEWLMNPSAMQPNGTAGEFVARLKSFHNLV